MLGFAGANGIDFKDHAEESYNLPNEAGKSALVAKVSAVFLHVFVRADYLNKGVFALYQTEEQISNDKYRFRLQKYYT